jgi:hypothetical protein
MKKSALRIIFAQIEDEFKYCKGNSALPHWNVRVVGGKISFGTGWFSFYDQF